jgi:hypothetical protein
VDKRGGGGGGRRLWKKNFLNVNIINFENVDKPEGGGSDNVDKDILLNFGAFLCFFGHFNRYLVLFSLYLVIIKKKIEKNNK